MDRQVSIAFQTDKLPHEYIDLAEMVDRYPFDGLSVYCDLPFHPSYGPLLLMAPHVHQARLGPAAISPFRIHPIDIAAEAALLARLAPGRTYIGLARGAWLKQHGFVEPDQPIQAIHEAIQIIQQLLTGELAGFQGKVFKINQHIHVPYPLPLEKVPILIGTWGRKLATLAGEIADEVKVGGSSNPGLVPMIRKYIREGEIKAGRPPGSVRLVMGAICVVAEDRVEAIQVAKRAAVLYLPVVARLDPTIHVDSELVKRLEELVSKKDIESATRLISNDLLKCFGFGGSPKDIIEQAESLFQAGVDRIEFGTPHGLTEREGVRLLGEKVLPVLKQP